MGKYTRIVCILLVVVMAFTCTAMAYNDATGTFTWSDGSQVGLSLSIGAYTSGSYARSASATLTPYGITVAVASLSAKMFTRSGTQRGTTASNSNTGFTTALQTGRTTTTYTDTYRAIGYYSATYSDLGNKYTTLYNYY